MFAHHRTPSFVRTARTAFFCFAVIPNTFFCSDSPNELSNHVRTAPSTLSICSHSPNTFFCSDSPNTFFLFAQPRARSFVRTARIIVLLDRTVRTLSLMFAHPEHLLLLDLSSNTFLICSHIPNTFFCSDSPNTFFRSDSPNTFFCSHSPNTFFCSDSPNTFKLFAWPEHVLIRCSHSTNTLLSCQIYGYSPNTYLLYRTLNARNTFNLFGQPEHFLLFAHPEARILVCSDISRTLSNRSDSPNTFQFVRTRSRFSTFFINSDSPNTFRKCSHGPNTFNLKNRTVFEHPEERGKRRKKEQEGDNTK